MPERIEDLLRELAPQVLGVLARQFGDFSAAEDATQEALLAAATHWDTVPDNPRGWLIRTGSRKLLDQLRADQARRRREVLFAEPPPVVYDQDDTLVVVFLCCHPRLSEASAIALTLRAVGGLTTGEIARAFLVPEATMGQRISRAKQRIRTLEAPFRMPDRLEWATRLRTVLHVLYLIFNEGYASSSGPLVRVDLSGEAIRLARMLHGLLPDDGEVAGLLALMLLTDARRPARVDASGDLVPLAEQDRGRWLRPLIQEGTAVLDAAFSAGAVGPYQLQAAIAALHDRAGNAQETDWPQILALYGLLERMTASPVVALNRAVAAAMVHGPQEGLRLLSTLDGRVDAGHRLDAVRGHLHELAGDATAAALHYRAAAAGTASSPERRYLTMRAARLRGSVVPPS
ncbi:RNA polymerase sigma factor [Dactylosporangium siamense]|uniref:RNA polymerase sigma24 factor n=1 Tax=Dactylosporangium siamense TaxID=685454 RepID=A0A919PJ05_9ACTN|nr:DUF6596 domain-containing protein [Dactylosporangium siamense]GIG44804.1 RNA polymerase sigma24 factor [Dactylosporangium siamense]